MWPSNFCQRRVLRKKSMKCAKEWLPGVALHADICIAHVSEEEEQSMMCHCQRQPAFPQSWWFASYSVVVTVCHSLSSNKATTGDANPSYHPPLPKGSCHSDQQHWWNGPTSLPHCQAISWSGGVGGRSVASAMVVCHHCKYKKYAVNIR